MMHRAEIWPAHTADSALLKCSTGSVSSLVFLRALGIKCEAELFLPVEILVQDIPAGVQLEVSSFGPQISQDEEAAIFGLFVRGAAAKRMSEEGTGYGLYVSQLVARQHLGTEIVVETESGPEVEGWSGVDHIFSYFPVNSSNTR